MTGPFLFRSYASNRSCDGFMILVTVQVQRTRSLPFLHSSAISLKLCRRMMLTAHLGLRTLKPLWRKYNYNFTAQIVLLKWIWVPFHFPHRYINRCIMTENMILERLSVTIAHTSNGATLSVPWITLAYCYPQWKCWNSF